MDGFLLIDKPEDWTSFDAVAWLRGVTGTRRIGHAGTLDPFATGLLIVGVNKATKRLALMQALEKEYVATIRFGATSTTEDRTGEITPVTDAKVVTRAALDAVLPRFLGEQDQIPPMYSAKRIGGRRLCDLARKGETIERQPSRVTIHSIEVLEDRLPEEVVIRVVCGSGTYIRTLGKDLGEALGTGAYLQELRRTRIGKFRVEDAVGPKEITRENWEGRIVSQ